MSMLILQIKWQNSVEYVPVDLSAENSEGIIETYEQWKSGERIVYTARYVRTNDTYGNHQFVLDYVTEKNSLLAERQNIDLGKSHITISGNTAGVEAFWESETKPEWNGPAKASIISSTSNEDELREIERGTRTAIRRPGQALLREMLRTIDAGCAISNETTPAALEAAHIHGVADHGVDGISNGILLRADLHRLYDSGHFDITLEGTITYSDSLSEDYKKILSNATIDKKIMSRIESSLRKRQLAPSTSNE